MTQPPPQPPPSNPNIYPISPWPMWTPPATSPVFRPHHNKDDNNNDDDDSWEVRAFAEDTGSLAGTTWPPRSYTCTFCRREFSSAQALGGHMNVHRRDRARLQNSHQLEPLHGQVLIPRHSCCYNSSPLSAYGAGFCVVCQQLLSSHCNGVLVGTELSSIPDAEPLIENVFDFGEGDEDQEAEVGREVELDLELRLGN